MSKLHRLRPLKRHIIITVCLTLISVLILNSIYQAQAEGSFKPTYSATAEHPNLSVVKITNNPARDFQPAWSPDGATIVFGSDRIAGSQQLDVYDIKPDGSNERLLARVTAGGDGRFFGPSWLGTSGDLLVIDRNIFWEMMRIRLSDAVQNNSIPISRNVRDGDSDFTTRLMFVPGGQGASSPVTSPDGSKLAWAALIDSHTLPDEQQRYEVRIFNGALSSFIGNTDTAGSLVFRTDPGGQIGEGSGDVAFSPDGNKVCIAACPNGWLTGKRRDLFVIDLNTGERQRLTTSGEQGRDNLYVTWSTQNRIAFSSRAGDSGNYDLYTIKPDGTELTRLTDSPADEITPSWNPDGSRLAFASDETGNYELYITNVGAVTPTPTPTLTPSPTPTPTPEPCDLSVDGDLDGIPDCWEVAGIDYNGDGVVDLRLDGADPLRKDIYVEIDYMEAADHTHQPRADSLSLVRNAFGVAPVDGGRGINLHLILDEKLPHSDLVGFNPTSPCGQVTTFDSLKGKHLGTKAEQDSPNFVNIREAKRRVFRYAVFGHRHGDAFPPECDSSGIARLGRGDFIVSLGGVGDYSRFRSSDCRLSLNALQCGQKNIEAGTFMHELGHALGLRHGGNENINCKPNYLSVMSYSLQFPNLDPTRPLDYSRQVLGTLDEARLDERSGIMGPRGRYAVYGAPEDFLEPNLSCRGGYCAQRAPADGPINWDDSLNLFYGHDVKADINRIPYANCDGQGETLTGFDDWKLIEQYLRELTQELSLPISSRESLVAEESEPELTVRQILETAESADFDADGVSNADDNCPAVFNPGQADADGNGLGDLCQTAVAADLSVSTAVSQNPALIGANITYVVTITNHGPNDADAAALSNVLPTGTTFVSCTTTGGGVCGGTGRDRTAAFPTLANGASATVTLVAAIDVSVPDGALLTSTSSIGSTTSDPNTVNNATALKSVALAAQKNPIDAAQFFVREHYNDFLNREPDAEGLAFWTNEIDSCGADAQCREVKRINVSAAFFLSIEFQQTGYLAYRAHKAAFGNLPDKPVPITREDLLQGVRVVGNGVVVNADGWEQKLEQNKRAYFEQLTASERFTALYPQSMTAEQYVAALNTNAGGVLSVADEEALAAELRSGAKTRAQALRAVAEDADLATAELNRAFVLMQYFGYLRRNPDEPPEPGLNFGGWNFWLSKLNEFNGNFIRAEMVKAFLDSIEYRQRFSQ